MERVTMAINFVHTKQVIEKMAAFYAAQAKLQLEVKHTRISIRAKWKKVGNDWQPVNVVKQKVRANYVASGNLVRSIKPYSDGMEFGIKMDWYGEAIRQGRQPMGKFRGGKGIPVSNMVQWSKMKRLRPKDSKGQFIANNARNREAMQFMMNRKIKYFGIEPFDFIKKAKASTIAQFKSQLDNSVKEDIKNSVNGTNI